MFLKLILGANQSHCASVSLPMLCKFFEALAMCLYDKDVISFMAVHHLASPSWRCKPSAHGLPAPGGRL